MKQVIIGGLFFGLLLIGMQIGQHLIAGFGASPASPAPAPPSA